MKESSCITLPTCISTEDNNTSHTQIVEPTLGFTLAEIRCAQNEPKLTVPQLLAIEFCKDYAKTPLQTLDGIYVTQPKRFLPLAQEVKKLVEEFQKKEIASQWVGLPPEKLLQESFVEQLDALQSLDQLALLIAAKEHLPGDIINILELLGKVDNIPFNQLYVVPQRSWGDRSDTDHSKCLLLGGRRLNLLTIIPKPKGSGGARAATAQIGPANERNKTK